MHVLKKNPTSKGHNAVQLQPTGGAFPGLKCEGSEGDELWVERAEQVPWTTEENLRIMKILAQSIKQPALEKDSWQSETFWVLIPILFYFYFLFFVS